MLLYPIKLKKSEMEKHKGKKQQQPKQRKTKH